MPHVKSMLDTHPGTSEVDRQVLEEAITAITECATTCSSCADACLGEADVQDLVRCIRLNLDCADICEATARTLVRQTESDWRVVRAQLEACAEACRSCGAECRRHAVHHEHCRVCADACQRCAEACDRLLAAIPAA
jgi:uncharacterized membrane protein